MWEYADPADTRAKLTNVSEHNMASQLMFVLFMAFTSLRNLALSYWLGGQYPIGDQEQQSCTFKLEKEYGGRGFIHSPSRAFGGRRSARAYHQRTTESIR